MSGDSSTVSDESSGTDFLSNDLASALIDDLFPMDVTNPHFSGENIKYCRSSSKAFFAEIESWQCKQCLRYFVQGEVAPKIAYCGHFIHEHCHKSFICGAPSCEDKVKVEEAPLSDAVLEDFIAAIKGRGFQCIKCNRYHPECNIVYFPSYTNPGPLGNYCMVCTFKEVKKNNELTKHPALLVSGGVIENDERFDSLDRTKNSAGYALRACCICKEDMRNRETSQVVHLPCNHFGHKGCAEKEIGKIVCKICGESCAKTNVKERTWHGKDYVIADKDTFTECPACSQSHPTSNLVITKRFPQKDDIKCHWCAVKAFGPKYLK